MKRTAQKEVVHANPCTSSRKASLFIEKSMSPHSIGRLLHENTPARHCPWTFPRWYWQSLAIFSNRWRYLAVSRNI